MSRVDLVEIATALQDQTLYEYRWLIDPESGQLSVWTEDGGIDGRMPVDVEDVDLLPTEPLPSWVWYQDMADFAEGISDERAGRALARAIQGKGAFRRFQDRLHRTIRSYCRHGMPSALPEPNAAQSSGWSTTRSSTTRPPRVP